MNYSRRQLYALGEPLGDSVTVKKVGGGRIYGGGGGGGGGPQQSTTYNTNLPEYAKPYVTTMLGATQKQLFEGTPTAEGGYDITGFRGYKPYSTDVNNYFAGFSPMQQQAQQATGQLQVPGQFGQASGLAGAAGMGALSAAQGAGALGSEALGYGATGQMYGGMGAQQALQRAQQTGRQAGMYGGMGAGYGAQAAGMAPTAQAYGQQAADIGMGGLGYGALGSGYGAGAAGLAPVAQTYGQAMADIGAAGGAGAGALAGDVARQAMRYGQQGATAGRLGLRAGEEMGAIGSQGLGYGAMGAGYGGRGAMAAEQGFGAGEQFARQATDPYATQAYMSPYMQNVVDYQKSQALRDFNIGRGMRGAQAVGKGAFGGSRQAIVEAEAERALGSQLQGIAATGSQKAFEDAQRQQQFGANLGLQGLQAGYGGLGLGMQGVGQGLAGLGTAMQGQQGRLAGLSAYQQGLQGAQAGLGQALGAGQLGLSGTQQALAGQQGALSSLGQAGQLYGLGMQGAGVGLSGLGTALQGQQARMAGLGQAGQFLGQGMQGAGYGLQGVGAQQAAGQLGLAGTAQGMQGAQAGMQGVQGAIGAGQYGLSGLGQATQAAGALGQLGGQQLGAQRDIIGMQSQMGKEQQALEQAKINQAIQDYATQQQYPLMQLGFMSNMLRGLPMQATTTQSYQAQPSTLNQGLGVLAGAAGARQAGLFAEGGTIRGLAAGGVAGYANRGMVQANPDSSVVRGIRSKLEMMGADELARVAQTSPSEEIRAMAIQILQEQKIREQAEAQAQQSIAQDQQRGLPTPVTERAGLPAAPAGSMDMLNAASGGIVAFAGPGGSQVDLDEDEADRLQKEFTARQRYAEFFKQQREDAGVGVPKASLANLYAKQQADLAEDRKRKAGYDLLNFGLELGTQPGGLLQAGLQAGKRALPGMIAREDTLRGRESDIAKGMAEVAEGERLMKLGDITGGNAMFEKAEDRFSKERVAGTRASIADKAENHARAFLANARANNDNRPEEIILLEGRNDYLTKMQQAQMARVGVAGEQVATTKETQADKEIRENKDIREWRREQRQYKADAPERAALQQKIDAEKEKIRTRYATKGTTPAPSKDSAGKPALPPGFKPDKT